MKKLIEEDSVIIYDEIAQVTYRITDNGGNTITIDVTSPAGEFTGEFIVDRREFDLHDLLNLLSVCRRVYREREYILTKKIGE